MKYKITLLLTILALLLLENPDGATAKSQPYFSKTLAEMKCKKISDRDERNGCLMLIEQKEAQFELQQQLIEPFQDKPNYSEESCKQFTDTNKRALCFSEYHKRIQEKKQKKIERESVEKKKQRSEEPVLKIVPCEQKTDHLEKITCYNEFHEEQLKKKLERAQKSKQKAREEIIMESPTLREMRCKKIADRTERNDCFQDLHEELREQKEETRRAEVENFDYNTELKHCLSIHNNNAQADCFDDLSKKTHRIFEAQDRQFDPTAND